MPRLNSVLWQIVNQIGVAFASKLVPVAAIFIYSRLMSVDDYGMFNVFQSYVWIFAISLSLNLHIALGRYVYLPDAKVDSFLGTTLMSLGALLIFGTTVVLIYAEDIASITGLSIIVLPIMLFIVVGYTAESILTQMMIYDQRSDLLLFLIGGKALISLSLSVTLLIFWPSNKVFAVLFADALASAILAAAVFGLLRRRIKWTWCGDHVLYIARYALPLLPYMIGLTLLSQFDRVLIDRFYGRQATGLYSIGYNLSVLMLMVVTAALNALTPSFFSALTRGDYARIFIDSRAIFSLALVGTAVLVVVGPELAAIVLPSKYLDGFRVIPVVALGGLCFVVFQTWVRVLAFGHRTGVISAITVVCAIINIGLNFFFLPSYGWQIAAWTTVVAYSLMSIGCVVAVNTLNIIPPIRLRREVVCVVVMGAAVVSLHSYTLPIFIRVVFLAFLLFDVRYDIIGLIRRDAR